MIHWREEWQKHQFVIPKSFYGKGWKQGIQSASGYRVLQCTSKYWALLGCASKNLFFIKNRVSLKNCLLKNRFALKIVY